MSVGIIQVTVAAGSPAAVMQGVVLQDGVYAIEVSQDNTGVTLNVSTPYGVTGQSGFARGDDIG